MKVNAPLISLEQAKSLVAYLELGEQAAADQLLAEICSRNSNQMFEQIGHLTRQLHTSLNDFRLDPRIPHLATQEIPDAKERLNYVITMTDQAANRTMDAVEASLPLADALAERIQQVQPSWRSLMTRRLALGEFKALCHQLDVFIAQSEQDANQLHALLTDILMAQDFQDLTGQMIRKVITLVQEVETKLVDMLLLFGEPEATKVESAPVARCIKAEGPIINKDKRTDVVANQDDVDDLLSSLGF